MQLAKSIMLKSSAMGLKAFFSVFFLTIVTVVSAQSNSPYSRYGLGDAFPSTNITTRGMGGISAGYSDIISINFNNPASYASFYALQEKNSKKLQYGRVVFDAGLNLENRTLIAPNTTQRFTSSDAYFSYLQVGLPLRKNWGLSFGLRPLTRVSYKINKSERLIDPLTHNPIDSAITQFSGTGGSFLPTIGTGFGVGNFSAGVNLGYMFGRKELSTRRALLNDSVSYFASEHNTNYSFGSLFFNAGLQYRIDLKAGKFLRLGVAGNWKQTIGGSQDILRQTFTLGSAGETLQIDSVFQQSDVKGDVVYPSNYTAGFVYNGYRNDGAGRGFLFGVDFTQGKWSEYRFFGQKDSVQDSWKVQAGGQINPKPTANSYFSRLSYRFGFSVGQDYIKVQQDLPTFGASFGVALPIRSSRLALNQFNSLNLSFEYLKRGNNDNVLKENLFRFSVGFNFTDLWFIKKKYE
jgi:hypothetical protein